MKDIRALQVLDAPFAGTRPGYAAHDARMREVFAELTPSSIEVAVDGPNVLRKPMPATAQGADSNSSRPADTAPTYDATAGSTGAEI